MNDNYVGRTRRRPERVFYSFREILASQTLGSPTNNGNIFFSKNMHMYLLFMLVELNCITHAVSLVTRHVNIIHI